MLINIIIFCYYIHLFIHLFIHLTNIIIVIIIIATTIIIFILSVIIISIVIVVIFRNIQDEILNIEPRDCMCDISLPIPSPGVGHKYLGGVKSNLYFVGIPKQTSCTTLRIC